MIPLTYEQGRCESSSIMARRESDGGGRRLIGRWALDRPIALARLMHENGELQPATAEHTKENRKGIIHRIHTQIQEIWLLARRESEKSGKPEKAAGGAGTRHEGRVVDR